MMIDDDCSHGCFIPFFLFLFLLNGIYLSNLIFIKVYVLRNIFAFLSFYIGFYYIICSFGNQI
ncbi:hypothetical protein F5Y17DRAFT_280141 [Xylariaceae sp. FL0594]|nr:hypothetical protein F5Y17DRAFT_280141 [Xylariaceae sp. FL0594]